jgi:hypothetical protein
MVLLELRMQLVGPYACIYTVRPKASNRSQDSNTQGTHEHKWFGGWNDLAFSDFLLF